MRLQRHCIGSSGKASSKVIRMVARIMRNMARRETMVTVVMISSLFEFCLVVILCYVYFRDSNKCGQPDCSDVS